jgi:hypothetical protein
MRFKTQRGAPNISYIIWNMPVISLDASKKTMPTEATVEGRSRKQSAGCAQWLTNLGSVCETQGLDGLIALRSISQGAEVSTSLGKMLRGTRSMWPRRF